MCWQERKLAMDCLMTVTGRLDGSPEGQERRDDLHARCNSIMTAYKDCKKSHRFDKCAIM